MSSQHKLIFKHFGTTGSTEDTDQHSNKQPGQLITAEFKECTDLYICWSSCPELPLLTESCHTWTHINISVTTKKLQQKIRWFTKYV